MVLSGLTDLLLMPWAALTSTKKVVAGPVAGSPEEVNVIKELAEAEAFMPVIDRHYPLDQIVQAHAYVDTGRKKGSVIINVGE
jgi:D-arabinose 1-dehydrogenase-like Zn-dependent alcohol dehydrogenase